MLGVAAAAMPGIDFKGIKLDTVDTDKVNKAGADILASYHFLTT